MEDTDKTVETPGNLCIPVDTSKTQIVQLSAKLKKAPPPSGGVKE